MPTHCTTIELPNNGHCRVIARFDGGLIADEDS